MTDASAPSAANPTNVPLTQEDAAEAIAGAQQAIVDDEKLQAASQAVSQVQETADVDSVTLVFKTMEFGDDLQLICYTLTFPLDTTVGEVSGAIYDKHKVPVPEQQLVYNGETLSDPLAKLSKYGFSTTTPNQCNLYRYEITGLDTQVTESEVKAIRNAHAWLEDEEACKRTADFLFTRYDEDANGYITIKEFKPLMKRLFKDSGLDRLLLFPDDYTLKKMAKGADTMSDPFETKLSKLEWQVYMIDFLKISFKGRQYS